MQGRQNGQFSKLFKYAIEGFISYTTFPLKSQPVLGLYYFFMCDYLFVCSSNSKTVFWKSCAWISDYCCIDSSTWWESSLQFLELLEKYLARMYIQGKHRPIYIEKKLLDYKKDDHEEN